MTKKSSCLHLCGRRRRISTQRLHKQRAKEGRGAAAQLSTRSACAGMPSNALIREKGRRHARLLIQLSSTPLFWQPTYAHGVYTLPSRCRGACLRAAAFTSSRACPQHFSQRLSAAFAGIWRRGKRHTTSTQKMSDMLTFPHLVTTAVFIAPPPGCSSYLAFTPAFAIA